MLTTIYDYARTKLTYTERLLSDVYSNFLIARLSGTAVGITPFIFNLKSELSTYVTILDNISRIRSISCHKV